MATASLLQLVFVMGLRLQLMLSTAQACSIDTGGTCNFADCYASRGPAYCSRAFDTDHSCLCKPGFCANGDGKCVKDPALARGCSIDKSEKGCTRYVRECDDSEQCTGTIFGVCECKPGYCKDENGDCKLSGKAELMERPRVEVGCHVGVLVATSMAFPFIAAVVLVLRSCKKSESQQEVYHLVA